MVQNKSKFVENLDEIYCDLLSIHIDENDSFKTSMNKFL